METALMEDNDDQILDSAEIIRRLTELNRQRKELYAKADAAYAADPVRANQEYHDIIEPALKLIAEQEIKLMELEKKGVEKLVQEITQQFNGLRINQELKVPTTSARNFIEQKLEELEQRIAKLEERNAAA